MHSAHPAARQQAAGSAARATRTYVNLGALCSSDEPSQLPWSFLKAAPGLTIIDIQLQQVPELAAGPPEVVCRLAGRLKALGVEGVYAPQHSRSGSGSSRFEALGRLLAACSGLQALHVTGDVRPAGSLLLEEGLLAGDSSSSSSSGGRAMQANPSSMSASEQDGAACAAATAAGATAKAGGSSSSSGGGTGEVMGSSGKVPAPLLQLQLDGVPLAPFAAWLQQRGQLGQLQRLELKGGVLSPDCIDDQHLLGVGPTYFDQSWDWLTSLVDLQDMELHCGSGLPVLGAAHPQPGLTALQALTQLSIKGFEPGADLHQTLSALTQLKQLQLNGEDQYIGASWRWLTALTQLTHLNLSSTPVEQLPEELGEALPHLEVLLVVDCYQETLPKGLTRLSHLDASSNEELGSAESASDGLEGLCDATSLRRLNLSGCSVSTTRHLKKLKQLEVLQLRGARRLCHCITEGTYCGNCFKMDAASDDSSDSGFDPGMWGPLPAPLGLPAAVNLRHLDLRSGEWWVEDLVAAGPLQHLTFLDLWDGVAYYQKHSDARHLPDLGVLPSLQQLNLGGVVIERRDWSSVGAWLGLQTQLTRLSLRGTGPEDGKPSQAAYQVMAQLPTQLVELDVRESDLRQLPVRLSQMTGLNVLLLGGGEGLPPELPPWLPALQQLEVLEVGAVEDVEAAVVLLQQLSALRQFSVSQGADDPSGEEAGPAEQLYGQLPHLQRVEGEVLEFGLFGGAQGMQPDGQG